MLQHHLISIDQLPLHRVAHPISSTNPTDPVKLQHPNLQVLKNDQLLHLHLLTEAEEVAGEDRTDAAEVLTDLREAEALSTTQEVVINKMLQLRNQMFPPLRPRTIHLLYHHQNPQSILTPTHLQLRQQKRK